MGTGKIFDLYHLIRQTDLFLLDGSEFASDRIDLVFLPADDGLVDCIQLLQCETCQKFLWIYRLSVLQYLIGKSGLFKEYICRIVHLVLQLIGHKLIHLIFQKFLHQFRSWIFLFSLLIDFFREKHFTLDIQQCGCHNHKLTHDTKVFPLHGMDVFHILICDLHDGDIIDIYFIFFDKVQ